MTAVTLMINEVEEDISLVNSDGKIFKFTSFHVFVTLKVGWAAFFISQIFNYAYYAIHPSKASLYFFTSFCLQFYSRSA